MSVKRSVSFVGGILVLMLSMLPSQVSAIGFNDLQIGKRLGEINALKVCSSEITLNGGSADCYDKRDWKFSFYFPRDCVKTTTTFESVNWTALMGTSTKPSPSAPLTCLQIYLGIYIADSHNNIRSILREKYPLEHAFTDVDIERFNKGETNFLYEVFHGGEVSLSIKRACSKKSSSGSTCYKYDNYSYIEYRNKANAKILVDETKPQKTKKSDF